MKMIINNSNIVISETFTQLLINKFNNNDNKIRDILIVIVINNNGKNCNK